MEAERKMELRAVMSFVLVMGIIAGGLFAAIFLVTNKRKAPEVARERIVPTVEVITVAQKDHPVFIETQGVVESRRETTLAAEVSGRVVEISENLKRGSVVAEGERLLAIDPADYRSALARAEATAAESALVLAQEEARAEQALLDWEKLGRGTGKPLVLREPQLAAARAQAASAQAEVERARRDVERTEISAPFAASVREAAVEVGAVVNAGQMIAALYSSSDLEVRLALPLEDYGFLQRGPDGAPEGGIMLRGVIGGVNFEWPAEPVRLDQEIDRRTLSGNLIVRVLPDVGGPYELPPVGLFVNAVISGKTLPEVVEIPRRALMEDSQVLVVDEESRLEFREVKVRRSTEDTVVIDEGLKSGERISMTRVSAPVAGMQVQVAEAEAVETEGDER